MKGLVSCLRNLDRALTELIILYNVKVYGDDELVKTSVKAAIENISEAYGANITLAEEDGVEKFKWN